MSFQFNDAQAIQAGMALVPNLRDQLMEDALLKVQQQNAATDQLRINAAVQKQVQEQARAKAYEADLANAMRDGSPQAVRALMLKYPEFADSMKASFESLDADARQMNATQMGSIYANLNSGNTARAIEIFEQRIEADRAAGEDVSQEMAVLAELKSGDPARVTAAKANVGILLAGAVGVDKFSETYKALNPTDAKSSIQKEVEYYRSIGRNDLADQLLTNNADPLVQISGPDGVQVLPRSVALGGGFQQQGTAPATQGGGDPSGSGASIPATGAAIERTALSVVPGAIVTSRQRSPQKNAAVGGKANSFHLTDQARDFVPPKGMSMAQLASQLKAAMPGFDVINEGDHVHVEPAGRRSAGPVRVRSKQEYDRLPKGALYIPPDGSAPRTKT